mgnify:CR=1 FL=1
MNNCLENITDHLKPFLLRDIIIRTDKKILKKNYEIPYPFDIQLEQEGNEAVLNYHLSSFVPKSQINKVKCLDTSSKSKIYNNLVYIWPSEEPTL